MQYATDQPLDILLPPAHSGRVSRAPAPDADTLAPPFVAPETVARYSAGTSGSPDARVPRGAAGAADELMHADAGGTEPFDEPGVFDEDPTFGELALLDELTLLDEPVILGEATVFDERLIVDDSGAKDDLILIDEAAAAEELALAFQSAASDELLAASRGTPVDEAEARPHGHALAEATADRLEALAAQLRARGFAALLEPSADVREIDRIIAALLAGYTAR
jgi:hypothetical protein